MTSSRPAIMRSSVDFPQPDGPTSTSSSPSATSRSTAVDGGPHRRRRSWWRRGWRCQPREILPGDSGRRRRPGWQPRPPRWRGTRRRWRCGRPPASGASAPGQPMSTTMASGRAASSGAQRRGLGRAALGIADDDHERPLHGRGEGGAAGRLGQALGGGRWGRRRPAERRAPMGPARPRCWRGDRAPRRGP